MYMGCTSCFFSAAFRYLLTFKNYRYVRKELRSIILFKETQKLYCWANSNLFQDYRRRRRKGAFSEALMASSRWGQQANRAIGNKEDARALNEYLDILQNKVYETRKYLIERGKVVTAIQIRDMLSGKEQRERKLLALFKKHNNELEKMIGKGVAKGTWINFSNSYSHISNFLKSEYHVDEINMLSLDLEFIKRLYQWFRTTKKLNHNSTLKNIANMKKIVLDCVDKDGWLEIPSLNLK
jgi:hypothetical protein